MSTMLLRRLADQPYTPKRWTCQRSYFLCPVMCHNMDCQPIERAADEAERLASISTLEHAVLIAAWDGFPRIDQTLVKELQRQMGLPPYSFGLSRVNVAANALLAKGIIGRDKIGWWMTAIGEDYLD